MNPKLVESLTFIFDLIRERILAANGLAALFLGGTFLIIAKVHSAFSSEEARLTKYAACGWLFNCSYMLIEILLTIVRIDQTIWNYYGEFLQRLAIIISTEGNCFFLIGGMRYLLAGGRLARISQAPIHFATLVILAPCLFLLDGGYYRWAVAFAVVLNAAALFVLALALQRMIERGLAGVDRYGWAVKRLMLAPLWVYAILQFSYFAKLGLREGSFALALVMSAAFILASLSKVLHLFGVAMYSATRSWRLSLQAEELRDRRDFIAEMAHELFTPALALNLELDHLARKLPFKTRPSLDGMRSMTTLLDAIIYGAHQWIEHEGKPEQEEETVSQVSSVNHLLQAAIMAVKSTKGRAALANKRMVDLQIHYSRDVEVEVQSTKIIRVFINLLKNCYETFDDEPLKSTGLVIKIETSRLKDPFHRTPDRISVKITDNGKGIPAEVLSRITHERVSTKGESHGRGLHLSSGIIKENGGEIRVTSPVTADGRGTCVEILLCRVRDA